ncbi:Six-hairpin glycosidase-like protein [Lactarius akahatsu]|uniref:Six-hairpin glycosidase-like protein n=1 Tax=Lactarius akahatsu TaxID=416441 RepID=A0AAD4Q5L5_9AGAM|nr:Six-hairpin glycosidase-like protein [Lactarius akahatsu]
MHFFALSLAVGLHLSFLPYCAPAALWSSPFPAPLSPKKLSLIRANAINISTHSWELGTLAETLTEFEWPRLGVFSPRSIPPPARLAHGQAADVLSIAETVVAENPPGALPAPLINGDGAIGDPASIGVSVLLRSWTLQDPGNTTFADAAAGQLDYLLNVAPRAPNGAISHRDSQAQLWADFVYMAPPFIAYYGALLEDGPSCQELLQTAYDQVRMYREVLYDPSVGLWRHIALGNGTDPTYWGTGNGWAAAGALRVLATIQRSSAARAMKSQQSDLVQWVGEILDGAWKFQQENGTLLNYLNQPDSFPDSSSTALLAASTFRWASITRNNTHIPAATRALRLIRINVDDQGLFSTPSLPGAHSPEGQSFVLLLEAAVAAWLPFNLGKNPLPL